MSNSHQRFAYQTAKCLRCAAEEPLEHLEIVDGGLLCRECRATIEDWKGGEK